MQRIALIFDDQPRPETSGVYCRRALAGLAPVEHVRPSQFQSLPGDFDLYLQIDDGLRYQIPAGLHPSAYWAIDTHMDFDWSLARASRFDFVFAAQRDGAERLRQDGVSSAQWLPLACDPVIHRKITIPKIHDVCFVGNLLPGRRSSLVHLLKRHYPTMFVGQRYFEDMAETYSASRTVFNCSIKNDINMRVFEALACGSFLVTNDLSDNGLSEFFQDAVHLATYDQAEELLDKLEFYLKREDVRERVAAAGRNEALAHHTYKHRMQQLLTRIEQQTAATSVAVGAADDLPEATGELTHHSKDHAYFDCDRPELLALIPQAAARVLDIGCGNGRLGQALKLRAETHKVHVIGIELSEDAAAVARMCLDEVLAENVETLDPGFPEGQFDSIVCGDILEHLCDPLALLLRAREWLSADGCVVASIPNVRHHSVVSGLLAGNWTYETAGLLDQDHLRFFTRGQIERLFLQAGLHIRTLQMVPGPGYDEWDSQGRPGELQIGSLCVKGLAQRELEELFTYQYLIVAERNDATVPASPVASRQPRTELGPSNVEKNVDASPDRPLRILYLGNLSQPWNHEYCLVESLKTAGHLAQALDESSVARAEDVLAEIEGGDFDCLLFFKGRIGAKTLEDVLHPDGEEIAKVLRQASLPAYVWYVDRVHAYDFDRTRETWMRKVAPLCRIAFVTDGGLADTDWANWYVLRQGVLESTIQRNVDIPESERASVAFVGQLYGERAVELAAIDREFPITFITDAFGPELTRAVRSHRIIIGPRYPSAPGYWSNRVYWVLGHGGFLLAPEVEGMREEGFLPGVHYAALGNDPVADVRHWLRLPDERAGIAAAGQQLVLSRFAYRHRIEELCRAIRQDLELLSGKDRSLQASPPSDVRHLPPSSPVDRRVTAAQAPASVPGCSPVVWPANDLPDSLSARVGIAIVNYNTADLLSHLLFSLFRIVGRWQLGNVIVVDNASTDGSRALLRALSDVGLLQAVFNNQQCYHGPALNQALDLLLDKHRAPSLPEDHIERVWILDSDTIVLREDTVAAALSHIDATGAGLTGEVQFDALPEGYIHPSSMLVDLTRAFPEGTAIFEDSGAPATALHRGLRRRGIGIEHFPFRSQNYVLHLQRGTRRRLAAIGDLANRHYEEQLQKAEYHYHGNRDGKQLHETFLRMFCEHVPKLTPETLTLALLRNDLVSLTSEMSASQ